MRVQGIEEEACEEEEEVDEEEEPRRHSAPASMLVASAPAVPCSSFLLPTLPHLPSPSRSPAPHSTSSFAVMRAFASAAAVADSCWLT